MDKNQKCSILSLGLTWIFILTLSKLRDSIESLPNHCQSPLHSLHSYTFPDPIPGKRDIATHIERKRCLNWVTVMEVVILVIHEACFCKEENGVCQEARLLEKSLKDRLLDKTLLSPMAVLFFQSPLSPPTALPRFVFYSSGLMPGTRKPKILQTCLLLFASPGGSQGTEVPKIF